MTKKKQGFRKPSKTIAGVTPVAVMLPPRECNHGACVYCPNLGVPQSYTPKSPVVLRASAAKYNPYKQVKSRLKAYESMSHPTDKIEIIIMGGTFLQYPKKFQYEFIKGIYDGLNDKVSKTFEEAKKINETTKHRCVAICIETRPDDCIDHIQNMRDFGATRVELGVQIIDDKIYEKVNRGHKVKEVVDATKALKNAGFKVGYHIMPGLPGSNPQKDLKLFKKLFSDLRFKPDQLKIYPCQVMPGSKLENMFWKKQYKPYTKEQIETLLIKMLKVIPRYCRVMRIMREIHPDFIVAGTKRIDLRKDVEQELRKKNSKLKEIRYREIGFALRDAENRRFSVPKTSGKRASARSTQQEVFVKGEVNLDLKLKTTKYKASGGDEYFLEIINKDGILFGLLRLRIFKDKIGSLRSLEHSHPDFVKDVRSKTIKAKGSKGFIINRSSKLVRENKPNSKQAIIRELHVYGQAVQLGQKSKLGQHTGLGKSLVSEAERIVKKKKIKKLKVISGVGVREYYRKLGYSLEDEYMIKNLKS